MSEVAIHLDIEALEEGGYVATSPDVPGLVAEGRSLVEVAEIAQKLARQIVEVCIEYVEVGPRPQISSSDEYRCGPGVGHVSVDRGLDRPPFRTRRCFLATGEQPGEVG